MSCCLTRCGVARVVARARLLETGARRGVATKTGVQGWIAGLKKEEVLGTTMAYHEAGAVRGSGPLVLFLHGNPSSSYVWRNVIDTVVAHAPKVTCIAPDMVGMGSSGPSRTTGPTRYRMSDHVAHMDALLEKLSIGEGKPKRPVYIAAHDWGSFIGFNYAMRFPGAVLGMAHMEGLVAPFTSWADFPVRGRKIFQAMRFDGGEEIVLTKNAFIERVVPASVTHGLSETEMNGYRYPFPTRESREPILQMVRQIPFSEDPEDVVAVIEKYAAFMKGSPMPKLFIDVKPGYFSGLIRKLTASWPNQVAVQVAGEHFAQEDSADEIGEAIADFVTTNSNL